MKKSNIVVIAVSSVVVAGLIGATVVVSLGNRTPTGTETQGSTAGVGADAKDNSARKAVSPAMRHKLRPSRVFNGQRLPDMPMPTPQQRNALKAYGKAKEAGANNSSSTAPRTTGFDQDRSRGGQSVQNVIDRSRALKAQGKEEEAKKLLRNAIMIESNPYSRKVLNQELTPTAKTVDTPVPAR